MSPASGNRLRLFNSLNEQYAEVLGTWIRASGIRDPLAAAEITDRVLAVAADVFDSEPSPPSPLRVDGHAITNVGQWLHGLMDREIQARKNNGRAEVFLPAGNK